MITDGQPSEAIGTVPLPAPGESEAAAHPKEALLLKAAAERHGELAGLLASAAGAGEKGLDDADAVHDVRVASRRLGEVARLLAGFMDKPTAKAMGASLRALRRAMGDLRDSDVTREHLAKWTMPAGVKIVAREMGARLAADRERLAAVARVQMGSASVQGAMVILARTVEEQARPERAAAAEKKIETAVAGLLKKRQRQLRQAFGKAAKKQTAESLHAARIAVKKLRYVSELAAAAEMDPGMKKQVKVLKGIQELLGDHHDAHVIVEMLEAHLRDPREKPIRNLAVGWRKWRRGIEREQATRAAEFFARSYLWMNKKP